MNDECNDALDMKFRIEHDGGGVCKLTIELRQVGIEVSVTSDENPDMKSMLKSVAQKCVEALAEQDIETTVGEVILSIEEALLGAAETHILLGGESS